MPLDARQLSELHFYDRRGDFDPSRYTDEELAVDVEAIERRGDYWSRSFAAAAREGLGGRRLLDCGSGTGLSAVYFALKGARVTTVDLNPAATELTRRRARVNGVEARVEALTMPLEELALPDGVIDAAFGGMVLHHVDLERAGREIARVLRPGGRAVFCETSGRNPLLMFARKHIAGRFGVRRMATPLEQPLTRGQIERFARHFRSLRSRGDKLVEMLYYAVPRPLVARLGCHIDRMLFRIAPGMERQAYIVILELVK